MASMTVCTSSDGVLNTLTYFWPHRIQIASMTVCTSSGGVLNTLTYFW
jgi:hypothetical protein